MNYIEAHFVDTIYSIIAASSRLTALPLLGLSLSLSTVSGQLWGRTARKASVGWIVFFATLSFSALDLALLKSLPILGLSYGPARVTFIVMLIARSAVTMTLAISFGLALALRPGQAVAAYLNVFFGVQLFLSLCAMDGFLIEPFGGGTVRLDGIPAVAGEQDPEALLRELLGVASSARSAARAPASSRAASPTNTASP